ncbi:MAG: FHA domain-containing protein, partial [Planctomycetota bacterium]|nr:FHA domain-containing protein [Planctomycetota bacterium]
MPALLKFLSGTHTGSEALLPSGEYVLGGDDGADLVLADVAVKPRHALLRIHDDRWEIEPVEGAEVRVNGARIEGNTLVPSYQVVSLGGIHIALGPDGPWERLPTIPLPLPDNPRATGGDPPPAQAENEAGTNGTDPGEDGGSVPDQADPILEKVKAPERRGGRKRLAMALILLAAAGLAAYYYVLTMDPNALPVDLVRERLVSAGFSAEPGVGSASLPGVIGVEVAGSGRVSLSGLLATERELRRVIEATEIPDAALEVRLRSVEGEMESLAGALGSVGPAVRVSLPGNGFVVLLAGVVETAQDAEAVFRLARERLDQRIGIR